MGQSFGLILLAMVSVMGAAQPSYSSSIKQMHYQFAYDGNATEHGSQLVYVICDKCPEMEHLNRATKPQSIALKLSEEPIPVKQIVEPKTRNITVHFGKNSYTLGDPEKIKLTVFSRVAKEPSLKGNPVRVEGYTCDLGKKAFNDRLARRRASTVAAFLNKEGVRTDVVTGKGKCCYATNDPSQRALNRRVEATITNKGDNY